ncbi:MAG: ATP-binding protein [bacterium]
MFKRDLDSILIDYKQFPVIAILGPRQSGKTTLAKHTFKNYVYTSFEDPETRELAQNDPHKFFSIHENKHGIIIDEFQNVPKILSYIQLEVDEKKRTGYFILTGSQNFLMNQAITQSLAGRVGILTLLPLSINELESNKLIKNQIADSTIFNGGYPRLYDKNISPEKLYPSYIQSYVERDVRQLTNVGDLRSFQRFMQLCAGRIGQLLNLSELASVCGISVSTAQRWISILEASYILFLLSPYFKNFNKRITKSPKIYFYDTGLACSLLGIESPEFLSLHPLYGNIFESFIVADIYKQYFNIGKRPPVYFWRDLNGRLEVDCIIEQHNNLFPIEIKSGQTIASDYFSNIIQWNEISNTNSDNNFVIYGGELNQKRSNGNIISWKNAGTIIEVLKKN